MTKEKYRLDPHELQFDQVENKWSKNILRNVIYALTVFVSAVIIFFLSSLVLNTDKEKEISKEINELHKNFMDLRQKYTEFAVIKADLESMDKNIYRIIFEAEPNIKEQNEFESLEKELQSLENSELTHKTKKELKELNARLDTLTRVYEDILKLSVQKLPKLRTLPAIFPLKVNNLSSIAGVYGDQVHPILKTVKFHEGIDFAAKLGAPILATADGIVTEIKNNSERGWYIKIEHTPELSTIYAHCQKVLKRKGKKVKRGDVIALVGNSGKSFDAHLHYEIQKKGKPVDPKYYFFNDISSASFQELMRISERIGQSMD